ncbi:hypothetical protein PACID_08160 [Acidipropionibacterium acidipropionici ATCC 4875]|uniref:Uncharacterized protein n=1 Tax=Acidipropionibacterium acidipropionici (strain ATCC 4875 / DSM 20272 / JCM 6432 / NBRC 12425 / NCIMB 8070 / 4) TaxID=1171373 RepID=K7RL57_ACIA4|nr:hypothetical protein PACID_08160 [Acidipropionibacterium acidipropionici ATCC 4875]
MCHPGPPEPVMRCELPASMMRAPGTPTACCHLMGGEGQASREARTHEVKKHAQSLAQDHSGVPCSLCSQEDADKMQEIALRRNEGVSR